jgi:hypothetical protein
MSKSKTTEPAPEADVMFDQLQYLVTSASIPSSKDHQRFQEVKTLFFNRSSNRNAPPTPLSHLPPAVFFE